MELIQREGELRGKKICHEREDKDNESEERVLEREETESEKDGMKL